MNVKSDPYYHIRSIKRRAPLDNDTLVAVTHPEKNICFGKDMVLYFSSIQKLRSANFDPIV